MEDADTVEIFKTRVWTLTNVPTDRQKFLGFPGGMLKDTDNLEEKVSKLKAGAKVTLMGTAEGNELKKPTENIVFEEDLTPEERAKILKEKKVEILPAGIKNLGNTCYLNSTLQCLLRLGDFRDSIDAFVPSEASPDATLTAQLRGVSQMLSSTTDSIAPLQFITALRQRFPRFAEMQNGAFMQQDAEECMRGLLQVCSETMNTGGVNQIDELFGARVLSKMKCLECDEEPPVQVEETQRILMCHLGTQNDPVSHIYQGVALSMKEHVEKTSPLLGRNAQYEKKSMLTRLPPFLVVQFARFGFKAASESAGTAASKVKVTRKVAFSPKFDVFDLADDGLKKQLSIGRLREKEIQDVKLEAERAGTSTADADGDVEMTPAGVEMLDTGYYELIAIVSHKGRTADGGHYVGWGRTKKADGKETKEDRWVCYDDDLVYGLDWKDMVGLGTDLQGGKVDTQIAYINIYHKVSVPADAGKTLGSAPAPSDTMETDAPADETTT